LLNWLRIFSRLRRAGSGADAQALHQQGVQANQAGQHREAAALLIRAIDAAPRVAETHYELGRAMRALQEPARAVTCFRNAIDIDTRHLDARIDLASVLLALGSMGLAAQAARDALHLDPRCVAAQVNLGAALQGQGKFAEAAECYRAALALRPDFLPALANLCVVCLEIGAVDEARRHAESALRIAPQDPEAHLRRGNVLMEQRLPQQAADSFREALHLRPGFAAACNALGFASDLQGDLPRAMDCYEQALAIDPDDVQAHLSRAANWLLQEDYARGWDEYEWRLRSPAHAPLYERFRQPLWDGSPLAGRRILVYAEQGLGDELLFASCLPEVVAQAAHCVIDCEPRLASLLRRSFPQATVHGGRQTDAADWLEGAGPVDIRIPAGSLPRYLRRHSASFPRHQGYLRAAPERVSAWRERLLQLGPGPKIGLSWRGGVPQTGRGSRSLALEDLLPVLRTPSVKFVNLQYGRGGGELAEFRQRHGIEILHWQEAIDDYEETAALVCALDLTLSVCTAIVDLGGALGRPVWVMQPVRSDFRYGLEGEALRWYPSVRLFRQARYGEWGPVIGSVAAALSALPLRSG